MIAQTIPQRLEPPPIMTDACQRFFAEYVQIDRFTRMLIDLNDTAESHLSGEVADIVYQTDDGDIVQIPDELRQEIDRIEQRLHGLVGYEYYLAVRDALLLAVGQEKPVENDIEADIAILMRLEDQTDTAETFLLRACAHFVDMYVTSRLSGIAQRLNEREQLRAMMFEYFAGKSVELSSHAQLLMQMTLSRTVDNFLMYIHDLMTLVYRQNPNMLKSGEKIDVEEVLKYRQMDDLLSAITERKVNTLSYQGMRDMAKYLKNALHFDLFTAPGEMDRAIELVEQRNLTVHNRAVVNEIMLGKLPTALAKKYAPQLGKAIILTAREVFDATTFLAKQVRDIDERAASKWSLPRPKTPHDVLALTFTEISWQGKPAWMREDN